MMFERYTEKARRVIFFPRYESSQFGSPMIEPEHLLLGLLRENKALFYRLHLDSQAIRARIEAELPKVAKTSTSIDLPLSDNAKAILHQAATEADGLKHKHIGTEHLFLALFSVKDSVATKILVQVGADPEAIRKRLAGEQENQQGLLLSESPAALRLRRISEGRTLQTVEIHGSKRNADYIRDVVSMVRSHNWHWEKMLWKPRDIVICNEDGKVSFELRLADDSKNFTLVKQGWKKDHCFVCRWELFETDGEHGIGYTNGRSWLCMECCERFVQGPDFFSSSHSEIT